MEEIQVTMTEFKRSLGDWVNRAAYGQTWVILMARGRPKAAIVSLEDLEELRRLRRGEGVTRRAVTLDDLDAFRERIRRRWQAAGLGPLDSAEMIRELREDCPNALARARCYHSGVKRVN